MNFDNNIKILESEIKKLFSNDKSHDIYHLKRVMNIAFEIQKIEGGDKEIIAYASLLHDIHRMMQSNSGKYATPEESLPEVIKILKKIKISKEKFDHVLKCIEYHEDYTFGVGRKADDIETKILQDADRIDAIGALGVARCFYYSGKYSQLMYVPEVPFDGKKYDASEMIDVSSIHHFKRKLLNLHKGMNTKTGKKLARQRHDFMILFLKEFFAEWDGKR